MCQKLVNLPLNRLGLCFSFVREHCSFVNEINCSLFGNKMMTNNYSSKNGFLGQNLVILEVLLGFIVKEI